MEVLSLLMAIIIIVSCILVFFLPTIIAKNKNSKYAWLIFFLNLVLGGTGVVWIILFIWALVLTD